MTMAARSGERLERGRAGGVDREHALHGAAGDDQGHGPVGAMHAAHAADEHAERRGVDERDAAQVDDQPVDARVEELQHALLELRSGVDVDFAGEGDDTESVAGALAGDAEQVAHCPPPVLDDGVGVGVVLPELAAIQSLTDGASGEFGSSLRNVVKASSAVLVSPALMATVAMSKNDCASFGLSAVICP